MKLFCGKCNKVVGSEESTYGGIHATDDCYGILYTDQAKTLIYHGKISPASPLIIPNNLH